MLPERGARWRCGVLSMPLALLCGCGSPSPGSATTAAPAARTLGARLYDGNCIACHQADGRGIPGVYPSLSGSPVVLGEPGAFARWVVKGERAPSMPAGRYSTVMPRFGWMKAEDAAALLSYLRTSFGDSSPAVDGATLAKALGD